MEPMCVHVCADEELIAIVSLEDFDNACEALKRIRQNKFTAEGGKTSDLMDQHCELKQLREQVRKRELQIAAQNWPCDPRNRGGKADL